MCDLFPEACWAWACAASSIKCLMLITHSVSLFLSWPCGCMHLACMYNTAYPTFGIATARSSRKQGTPLHQLGHERICFP